jgi:hypothetical protein
MSEIARRPGRPVGTTQANGAKVSPGRPLALNENEQKRYQHWLAWWATRPGAQPSARALAARMEENERNVQRYASGNNPPGPVALANLETLSAAYGYQPLVFDPIL